MTVTGSIDPACLLEEQLVQASPDLPRELPQSFVATLTSAEAGAVYGTAYGQSSPERVNRRNGYRAREFDTRVGTLEPRIPKLRQGTYQRGRDLLLARSFDPPDGLARVVAGHHEPVGEPGLRHGQGTRRAR